MVKTLAMAAAVGLTLARVLAAQDMSANDTRYVRGMLREAYDTVKKYYYDSTFRGLDLDARYREYDDRLKSPTSLNAGIASVAEFLDRLNDSHTYFLPPPRPFQVDYGYRVDLIGGRAFITGVHSGTDAASKVKPGDEVLTINGYHIDREGFHKMQYLLDILSPQSRTELVLRHEGDRDRPVTIDSTMTPKRIVRTFTNGNEIGDLLREQAESARWMRQREVEIGDVLIWKMPIFFVDNSEIDRLFAAARKHSALILDLRGNQGGLVDALRRMIGSVFDRDVLIAHRVARDGTTSIEAPSRGRSAYSGRLVVLIDSGSASAAELFARVIQLEQRGTVIGDRSSGAVMEARGHPFQLGDDPLKFYVFSVTEADLVMKDSQSLERTGVTPDETLLPSADDLAAGRDPVLARAAALVGVKLDPVAAGKLFPFEWRPF
jgi:C-terminal processing protease CtpA/Prc